LPELLRERTDILEVCEDGELLTVLCSWSFILTREKVLLAISVIIKSIWEGNK